MIQQTLVYDGVTAFPGSTTLCTPFASLEKLAATNKPPEVDPRRHFYRLFNREADEYGRDFNKKYHGDLNTTLIFVS